MKVNNNVKIKPKRTIGLILTLAVISLLAGASVSASVDEFLEPRYVEDNPYAGVVDDAVGDATWEEVKHDKKGINNLIKSFLKNRIGGLDEERNEHLEERIAAIEALRTALQFCLDNLDCNAESEVLSLTLLSIDLRTPSMNAKIGFEEDGWRYEDLTEAECESRTGNWASDEGKSYCFRPGGSWIDNDYEDKHDEEWFDCRTKELWTDEKQEWCDDLQDNMKFKPFSPEAAHKDWSAMEKTDISEKMTMTENSAIAISYCINNHECGGIDMTNDDRHDLNSILTKVGEEMAKRHADYQECHEELDCERESEDKQQREMKGLVSRMKDIFKDDDLKDSPLPATYDRSDFTRFEMTQEICEARDGTWTAAPDRGEGFYYCDNLIDGVDKECEDDEDENESEIDNEDNSQESCEEAGGTWSEDRQECY